MGISFSSDDETTKLKKKIAEFERKQKEQELRLKNALHKQMISDERKINNRTSIFNEPTSRSTAVPPPLPIRTRGQTGPWRNIGIAMSKNPADDTVFQLQGRPYDARRYQYEYRILDNISGVVIALDGGRSRNRIDDGDKIIIPGKEGIGPFIVQINSDAYSY